MAAAGGRAAQGLVLIGLLVAETVAVWVVTEQVARSSPTRDRPVVQR